jgi:hypothetical protein
MLAANPWTNSIRFMTMNPKIKNRIFISILCVIAVALCSRVIWTKVHENKKGSRVAYWRMNTWPAERKLTAEKVKAGQAEDETHGAVTIDLKPYINAKLTEAPSCWKGNNADNLAQLPAGTNVYAGVPFDVEGSIQLMGGHLQHWGKSFPIEVESITINCKCTKVYLLHAASGVEPNEYGTTLAKLLIHYGDKSTEEIDLIAGKQVFDWWFPTFTTGVPASYRTPAPDTELAWIGSNPYLRQYEPDNSLCLYRTSIENPKPGVAISSLDYVSTLTFSAPFLVGLTVE